MQQAEGDPSFWLAKYKSIYKNQTLEENRKLLKQATKSIDKSQFKNHQDYLELWFCLIDVEKLLSQDYASITDIFKYLGSNRIGVKSCFFYIKWAQFEHDSNYTDRAKRILQAAIQSKVEPVEKLQNALEELSGKENQPAIKLKSALRRPLQEKPVESIKSAEEDNTMNFKARLNRGRTKLGPPSRLPKSEVLVNQEPEYPPNQESFPSPESLNSSSPQSIKSSKQNSPLAPANSYSKSSLKNQVGSSLSLQNDNELEDSSSSDESSVEDLEERQVIDATQNMDLSHTVTIIQQTPKLYPSDPPIKQQSIAHPPTKDESQQQQLDKNQVVINGKMYYKSGLIGKGGSCKVFKIIDPSNGQLFAFKKVKLKGQDPSVIEGYKNEIILLNKLKNNDRIIRLFDAQHDSKNQTLLMVLEYGEVDLEKMLQKDLEAGRISINFVRNYWEQMVQAVQAIHDQNIIHSDLKPANFLLVSGCLKLIDFGIAKAIPNDTTNIQRDHQSGTVNYMSPESITPHTECDKESGTTYLKQGRASDIWSLGCILYRLVYHYPPFGKMSLMVKICAITNPKHEISYPDPPMGPEYLQVIPVLKGCLVFDPKKRLTIPQILAHEFLRGGKQGDGHGPPLDVNLIAKILEKAIELDLNADNVNQVAEKIASTV